MNKETILYIGGFELPDKNAAAHRVLNNGKALKKLEYNVVFIGVDRELSFNDGIKRVDKDIQGFECWSIPYPQNNREWIYYLCNIDYFIKVTKKINNIKAVICYNYQSVALLKIKRYCNKNNIKIIADSTEWYSTKGANIMFKIIKGFDSFLRMRIIQKRLDGVIVISNYLKDYYNKCKNVVYIPPLIDFNEKKWKREYEGSYGEEVRLIYAGSPGRDKDKLNLIINTLSEIDSEVNYFFKIVGITKEQYLKGYPEHKKVIDRLNNKISFLGKLPHIESLKEVKLADFSIVIRESTRMVNAGFPTKFVESMACRTPVVSSRISDLEDYLEDGENGFFIDINDKLSSKFIIDKIFKMKREEIESMKKKCGESNIFHYHNYINLIGNFFNKIISD